MYSYRTVLQTGGGAGWYPTSRALARVATAFIPPQICFSPQFSIRTAAIISLNCFALTAQFIFNKIFSEVQSWSRVWPNSV